MRAYKIESTPYNTWKIYERCNILWLFPVWLEFTTAVGDFRSLQSAESMVEYLHKQKTINKLENKRVSEFKPQTYYYY